MSDPSSSPPASAQPASRGLWARARRLDPVVTVATVVLAAACYVPSFLTRPGTVADDSKQYLYLDPGRLLRSAMSMWNPDVGMGTVTHQNIGFLFPMGPYYWVVQQLHIPMWVGQRFWMGSLFFFAGTGVFFLGRQLGLSSWGRVAAGVAYTFTPFVIDYITRISAIVMPWSALGWMVGLVILAVRRGKWRYPALFAVVIALVGGVNATSILLAGLAPAMWVVYAVWITKEVSVRRALAAVARISVLCLGVSLWWIAGLWAEGVYGLNILKFTETIPTVSSTSLSSEVVRGLGYWYFYGQDKLQPWTTAAIPYMQKGWLIGVGFALPAVCVIVGALVRWRYRAYAVALVFVGVVAAVAAYPFANPSPLGRALRDAGSSSTIGLAMRSTNRVVPLILLGFALLLGAGVSAIAARWLTAGLAVLALATAVAAADLPPLWNGTLVATNLSRPEQLPSDVLAAARYLNTHGTGRVFGVPGEDFAYYRWGVTGDPVWPGLLNRPYVSRQVVPQGEPASVDLLQAIDESMQDGVFVPATLAPVARLISASDILFQGNEQYERFNTARPQPLWLALLDPSAGLGTPVSFGKPTVYKTITYPLQDETQLAVPTGAPVAPPEAVFAVSGTRPLVRTETTSAPLLVAGSGLGLVDAAAAGLLDTNPTILYAASFAHDRKGLDQLLNSGAVLVLTDTNRRQQDTWGTIDDNTGYVEQADVGPLVVNPNQQALPPVPGGPSSQTVTTLSSVKSIRASAYGDPITNTPEDTPYNAFDQNAKTRWTEGAFATATGAQLQVTLTRPVTTAEITLLQPQTGPRNRWITRVSLTFDGHRRVTEHLGQASRVEPGQVVRFPTETFTTLTLTVDATSSGIRQSYNGDSGVGFADVTIPGVAPVIQSLRLPTDLLSSVGSTSLSHPLVILMNRIRSAPVPPRSDAQDALIRSFSLPTARTFSIGGNVRISAADPDPVIDQILGRFTASGSSAASPKAPAATVVFANSSGRLPGDLAAGAYAAIDGNPGTAWMPGFGPQAGNWLLYAFNRPVTFGSMDLQVVADGRHSIPTEITVSTGFTSRVVKLPPIADGVGRPQGSVTSVPILFPALNGQEVRITIDQTRPVTELDYYSNARQIAPVGIAEVGIPGVDAPLTPPATASDCLTDLISIDGTPVDVKVTGSTTEALSGGALQVSGCGNSANGVTLSAGSHSLVTAAPIIEGLNVDALWLSSQSGGGAFPLTPAGTVSLPAAPSSPSATVLHQDRTHLTVEATGTGAPYWLVLGQSRSAGWKASVQGGPALGSSRLIDGYANGWLVSGAEARGTRVFQLTWTPQTVINAALLTSGAILLLSLVLIVIPASLAAWVWRRPRRLWRDHRRRRTSEADSSPDDRAGSPPPPAPVTPGEDLPEAGGPDGARPALVARLLAGTRRLGATVRVPWRHQPEADLEDGGPVPGPPPPGAEGDTPEGNGEPVLAGASLASADAGPTATGVEPGLVAMSVLTTRGRRPPWWVMLLAAVLSGAAAGAVTAPIAAPIVAGAVLIGCLVPWTRLLFVLAPFGLLAATGAYMVVQQDRHHYASNIGWPEQFPVANTLTWMAVCALGAGAVVEVARWRGWLAGGEFQGKKAKAVDVGDATSAPPDGTGTEVGIAAVPTEPAMARVAVLSGAPGAVNTTTPPGEPAGHEPSPMGSSAPEVPPTPEVAPPPDDPTAAADGDTPATGEPVVARHDPDAVGKPDAAPPDDGADRADAHPGDLAPLVPALGVEPRTAAEARAGRRSVRSTLGSAVHWLASRRPGTLSQTDVPHGGEQPSDHDN